MKYGYARVSTKKQGLGTSLDEQADALKAAGAEIVVREEFTGTTNERPELTVLMEKLNEGDTLIVTKMDRFARSVRGALDLVDELLPRGIVIHILNMGIIDNTPMGKLAYTMMAGFAEFERDMIFERTQAGRAAARQRDGYREGRKPIARQKTDHAIELLEQGKTFKEVTEITGISSATIQRARWKQRALAE